MPNPWNDNSTDNREMIILLTSQTGIGKKTEKWQFYWTVKLVQVKRQRNDDSTEHSTEQSNWYRWKDTEMMILLNSQNGTGEKTQKWWFYWTVKMVQVKRHRNDDSTKQCQLMSCTCVRMHWFCCTHFPLPANTISALADSTVGG